MFVQGIFLTVSHLSRKRSKIKILHAINFWWSDSKLPLKIGLDLSIMAKRKLDLKLKIFRWDIACAKCKRCTDRHASLASLSMSLTRVFSAFEWPKNEGKPARSPLHAPIFNMILLTTVIITRIYYCNGIEVRTSRYLFFCTICSDHSPLQGNAPSPSRTSKNPFVISIM